MKSGKNEIIVMIGNIIFFIVSIYIFNNVKNYNANTDNIFSLYQFTFGNILDNISVFMKTFELPDIIKYLISMFLVYLPFVIISLLIIFIFNIVLYYLNKKTWNSWVKIPYVNCIFPRIIILPLFQIIYFVLLLLTSITFGFLSYIIKFQILQTILNTVFGILCFLILFILTISIYFKIEYYLTKIIYIGEKDLNEFTIKEYKYFKY